MGIETVGIVGAGTMGGGIGINLAQHGFRVLLTDARPEAANAAVTGAVAFWARAVEKGRMSPAQAEAAQARLVTVGSLRDLGQADLLIEAVFEDFELKVRLLTELSAKVRENALIAASTSCLRVGDLAKHVTKPERFTRACTNSARPQSTRSSRSLGVARRRRPPSRLRWPSVLPAVSSRSAAGIPTALRSTASSAPTPTRPPVRSMTVCAARPASTLSRANPSAPRRGRSW